MAYWHSHIHALTEREGYVDTYIPSFSLSHPHQRDTNDKHTTTQHRYIIEISMRQKLYICYTQAIEIFMKYTLLRYTWHPQTTFQYSLNNTTVIPLNHYLALAVTSLSFCFTHSLFSHTHIPYWALSHTNTHTLNLGSHTNTFSFTLTYHLYVTFFHSFSLWLSLLLSLSIFLYHFHSFIQFPLSFSLKSYHTSNCAF